MIINKRRLIRVGSGVIKIEAIDNKLQQVLDLICAQNDYIIKRLDEIYVKNGATQECLSKDIRDIVGLSEEIHKSFKERNLTYKQYLVLKYHLSNPYVSDIHLSNETEVSYSSISQWKHGDKIFRDFYDRIKSSK